MKKFFFSLSCMVAITANAFGVASPTEIVHSNNILQSLESFVKMDCQMKEVVRKSKSETQHKHGSNPHLKIREGTSLNWSGYAAATNLSNPAKDSVTQVSGIWTIPTLTATSSSTYSSIWVGIDGFTNTTVEQIGTEQDWISGSQHNYAWFEMYPGPSYEISGFPVNHGNVVAGIVSYAGDNIFELILINFTEQVFTIVPTSYTTSSSGKRSSAEWVVEAPTLNGVLPLADFGTVAFTDCSATISGTTGPINSTHWVNESLTMESASHVVKATPSGLTSGGTAFSVTWDHQ